MNKDTKIKITLQFAHEMKNFYNWEHMKDAPVKPETVAKVMDSVTELLSEECDEDTIEVKELKAEIDRLETIEQEAEYMKSELDECHHQNYCKEQDDMIKDDIHRTFIDV